MWEVELAFCLPVGCLACFWGSPNISGFYFVINLSLEKPFLPKVTVSSVPNKGWGPAPSGWLLSDPQSSLSALS